MLFFLALILFAGEVMRDDFIQLDVYTSFLLQRR